MPITSRCAYIKYQKKCRQYFGLKHITQGGMVEYVDLLEINQKRNEVKTFVLSIPI